MSEWRMDPNTPWTLQGTRLTPPTDPMTDLTVGMVIMFYGKRCRVTRVALHAAAEDDSTWGVTAGDPIMSVDLQPLE